MTDIKLFPSIEDVFQNPTEKYKTIFFPLLTIDLGSIYKGIGKVHFITVHGNGNPAVKISGGNFGYNFIKFKITEDKYRFDGDINQMPKIEKNVAWYKEAELIYKEHKDKYLTQSDFVREEDERRSNIDFDYAYYIEGVTNYWVTRDKFIETGKFIQGSAYTYGNNKEEREIYDNFDEYYDQYDFEYFQKLIDELGIKMDVLKFIGTLTGYNYSRFGEDRISLFINSDTNEVLQYFNWS